MLKIFTETLNTINKLEWQNLDSVRASWILEDSPSTIQDTPSIISLPKTDTGATEGLDKA